MSERMMVCQIGHAQFALTPEAFAMLAAVMREAVPVRFDFDGKRGAHVVHSEDGPLLRSASLETILTAADLDAPQRPNNAGDNDLPF